MPRVEYDCSQQRSSVHAQTGLTSIYPLTTRLQMLRDMQQTKKGWDGYVCYLKCSMDLKIRESQREIVLQGMIQSSKARVAILQTRIYSGSTLSPKIIEDFDF